MKTASNLVGRILFWLSWPAAVIYIHGSKRTRLLLTSSDEVLVIKGWIGDGRWGLPGGGLHKNEDPTEGLLREVEEETGLILDPRSVKVLGAKPFSDRGFVFECHYFCSEVSSQLLAKPHSEVKETVWIKKDSLNSRNATPDTLTALALVTGH